MTTGLAKRWQSATPAVRGVVVIVGLAAMINLALFAIEQFTGGEPGGKASSSYATAGDGVGAYAELLVANGHPVRRVLTSPSKQALDPATTVMVLDPVEVLPDDGQALRSFLENGGRLVASAGSTTRWLEDLLDNPPTIGNGTPGIARPLPASRFPGVRNVLRDGKTAWANLGDTEAALGNGEQVIVTLARVGAGSLTLATDASPLTNDLLARADNAAFGLALAGEPGRTVQFLETIHGYGESRGLAALPARWRWSLTGLAVAGVVYMASRWRRLGPPEEDARALPPPRRAYVDALAATLVKTRDPSAAGAPVQRALRDILDRRTGLASVGSDMPDETEDDALRLAASRIGIAPAAVEAALGTVTSNDDLMAASTALAELMEKR